MKRLLPLLLMMNILACTQDAPQNETPDEGVSTQANQPPETSATTPSSNSAQQAEAKTAAEKPEVGNRNAFVPPISEDVLILEAEGLSLKKGATDCLNIKAKQFRNLLSMQYTMSWDPKVVKFNKVSNFGLPYISQQNFGGTRLREGLLSFVWIDNQLKGTTLPDNSTIFTVCFDGLGEPGEQTKFQFVEKPTPFEVVNLQEEVQELDARPGVITITE